MLGENLQMWLNNLKIALVEKDTDKLNLLIDSIPKLKTKDEMKEALYLINEALNLVHELRDKTSYSMKKLKKNLNYLKSTQNKASSEFNIVS